MRAIRTSSPSPFAYIRLSDSNIQGAKVHVFGTRLPYTSAVFDDELMQGMEAASVVTAPMEMN